MNKDAASPLPLDHIAAVASAARAWRDPDYRTRKEAVAKTLRAENRFTREALAFAINQQMGQINAAALRKWVARYEAPSGPLRVGVLEAGNIPLAGLQDYLAVTCTGHRFVGCVSGRSPWLLPAFAANVTERGGDPASFFPFEQVVGRVDALIASGTDETMDAVVEACHRAGIREDRCLLRGHRYSIAVLDGGEHQEQRLRLAEDVLLHEGLGCRNVALIFAPDGLDADPYFEAFSVFRGTFPAHASTGGALKMQQAFLAAVGAPHAYGDGLVYLVSRGEADVQGPGHVRWVPYTSMADVVAWISAHRSNLQVVSGRPSVLDQIPSDVDKVPLGDTQRPTLDWCPDGRDTVEFLARLR